MRRPLRLAATFLVTGLATAYLVWKVDVGEAARTVADARLAPLAGAVALTLVTVPVMAWRWQRLLAARGIRERLPWLARAYLVSYTAGQILPTAVGGDAMRIFEGARRHPGRGGDVAGSVLLERALGGAATLLLAAAGFALAVGRYDVGAYLWLEGFLVVATVVAGFVFFSRRARGPLARLVPLARWARVERPLRAVYEGVHAFREHGRTLALVCGVTLAMQAVRVLGIWLTGVAAGVDVSPRVYYVMGPLLFLVMLVPFTVNGLAVREAFFVSFLGTVGVDADAAFATGFLFFLVTIAVAVPGGLILAWESLRKPAQPRLRHG